MKPDEAFCELLVVAAVESSARVCGGCGSDLPSDWPGGYCATCLLFSELPDSETGEGDATAVSGARTLPFAACTDFAERYCFLDEKPVGRGGQGQIFQVRDARLRRTVAMKRLKVGASELARSRFLAEAQIASQLEHPGFLPIFDAGLDPAGQPFYTTVLLPGRTLAHVVSEVRPRSRAADLRLRRVIELLERISTTMAYAHERGVYHRDLKPSNILIGKFGEVFIIDFGSAQLGGNPPAPPLVASEESKIETDRSLASVSNLDSPLSSASEGFPGTPLYCPPESFEAGPPAAGSAADIYALGVILYEICAGRVPYARPQGGLPDPEEVIRSVRLGPPEPVRRFNRSAPRDLEAICEKATARDPAGRYATMSDLAADLRAFLETRVVQARRPGWVAHAQKWVWRQSRQLALATLVLAAVGISLAVAYSFKTQNDSTRQINHLREAQLAARQGAWRVVLDHLDRAQAAGYTNAVDLGLQRIDAWTALSESDRSAAELATLRRLPNLGPYQGALLLRLAEHELFDRATWPAGLDHARQAIESGLGRADQAFARGLLADTSLAALTLFQEALRFDAFHHGAHRASLGLEFLLGEREALKSHLAVFKVLYPDDPAPVFIEATWLAFDGRIAEAESAIAPWRGKVNARLWGVYQSGLELMSAGAKLFSIERLLQPEKAEPLTASPLLLNAALLLLNSRTASSDTNLAGFRFPQLPYVKNGLEQGVKGMMGLAVPLIGNVDAAVEQIKAACRSHPDALLPLAAAMFLEPRRPTSPAGLREFLERQAGLFQMAAGMPSAIRQIPRQARFMAALTQVELGCRLDPPDATAHRQARENLRWFLTDPEPSAVVFEACFKMARELGDLDLARGLLAKEEELQPADPGLVRHRIELELAAGAFRRALPLIEGALAANPDDNWAQSLRARAAQQLRELADAYDQSNQHVP